MFKGVWIPQFYIVDFTLNATCIVWLLVAIGDSMEQVAGGESWSVFMIMSAAQPDQSYPASKSDLHHDGDGDDGDDDGDDDQFQFQVSIFY